MSDSLRKSTPRTLIAGLGSSHGDDRAGWHVAEALATECSGRTDICVRRAAIPLDLLDWIDCADILHVCDTCHVAGDADAEHSVYQLRWNGRQLVAEAANAPDGSVSVSELFRNRGSHDFELPDVLRLAQATSRLPQQVIVWAVGGSDFEPTAPMSPATMAAAERAIEAILKCLELPADCHA